MACPGARHSSKWRPIPPGPSNWRPRPKPVARASWRCFIPNIRPGTSANAKDRHRGQISFPGGRFEPQDKHLANTALREAEEEVGVDAGQVELIGGLTDLYIPVSNFRVDPYVGYTEITPDFIPQESEVNDILEVPVEELIHPGNLKYKDLTIREGFTIPNVPYFDLLGKTVWGATAMMLSELVELIRG